MGRGERERGRGGEGERGRGGEGERGRGREGERERERLTLCDISSLQWELNPSTSMDISTLQ